MIKSYYKYNLLTNAIFLLLFFAACQVEKNDKTLFDTLDSKRTGLNFTNKLTYNNEFNLFNYIYFYNGSGVGAGDFNNDGLIDLFFASNQQQNKLFLNNGSLKFSDVTVEAKIPHDNAWSTGVSVVDINNDGLLDVYVCRVGQYETLHSKNQLLINQGVDKNGIPSFTDKAVEYGLDFSGFSTQAAFFDYDLDGDIDMYLLNHSVHENGTFRPRSEFIGTYHPLSGDRLYQNKEGKFIDVTMQSGINSSAIGYGLGIAVSDINLDGYPDIYIGNDFHEDDYLYINQKNGTFKETGREQLMHTSQFSMGVDVADVNNDAWPEIISMDMLPSDPYILKRSLGEDAYDIFKYKISVGYTHQYARNNLQYNRRNGMFSEIGLYSGVAATDWSWAPLWMDFNNDGLKDIFISNGIPKRMNDIDYINFVSGSKVQQKIRSNNVEGKDIALISKFPEIKIPNKFYLNKGDFSFNDEEQYIGNDSPTFSNGAVYADLDNDGDLDIAVNNIDEPSLLYENKTAGISLEINLKGPEKNINAIGARAILFAGKEIRTYEKFPARGFMSSMEIPLLIGLENTKVDSLFIIWPDNSFVQIKDSVKTGQITLSYQPGLPLFDFNNFTDRNKNEVNSFNDITNQTGLHFLHQENHFVEFDREPLMPHMISTEGPALAVADINKDGRDDVFIGGARDKKRALFIQQTTGKFSYSPQPALEADSMYEDVAASWIDVNNDGFIDLVVASGGNEFFGPDFHNSPRVYLNNDKATLTRLDNAFDSIFLTASCIAPYDFNRDGYIDIFIGARAVPFQYGKIPQSYLLLNDKKGRFIDVTSAYSPELSLAGFITSAQWIDLDGDGDSDLLLSQEWGSIMAYINDNGGLVKKELTSKKGWWNFVTPFDIDNDGDIDLVAGNLGLNSRLKSSTEKPIRLYYNDFDENSKKEQVITYYLNGKQIPFASKAELEKQMPGLKKKFLYAEDFAKADLKNLFGAEQLKKAEVLSADYFGSSVLINNGEMNFEIKALPWQAQLTTLRAAVIINANNDNLPDLLVAGNYYDNNMEMGRYDADFGTILINKGNGDFRCEMMNNETIIGQVRQMQPISINNHPAIILVRNGGSAIILAISQARN